MASNVETGAAGGDRPDTQEPEGPIAAAVIAAGAGAFALGLLTTLSEMSKTIKDLLNFYDPVGSLAGKTVGAVVIWLVSWAVTLPAGLRVGLRWALLHMAYRDKGFETRKTLTLALILIALGTLGTFPIFFQAFAPAE